MANLGAGLTGALSGATTGATLGSFFPVIGTGIGATLGGLAGGLGGLFSGDGSQQQRPMQNQVQGNQPLAGVDFAQLQRFNPQQMGVQQSALQQALSLLGGQGSGLSNQFNFAPIAQQARTQFQQQTVPGLAERFAGLGSGAGLSSPAFASQLGQAGAGLEGQLAALQSQYGLQQQGLNQQLLNQLLGFGLQPQFENIYAPQQQSFGQSISPYLGQLLGQLGSTAIQLGGQHLYNKYNQPVGVK